MARGSDRDLQVKMWLLFSIIPGGIIHFGTRYLNEGELKYYIYIFILLILSLGLFDDVKILKIRDNLISTMILSSLVLLYYIYTLSVSSITAPKNLLIILSIYTSLYEEVLYRDKLLSLLMKQNSNAVYSSIIVSVLFGLMHFGFYNLPLYMIKSMIYCYFSVKSKSVLPSFVLHSINNIKYFSV